MLPWDIRGKEMAKEDGRKPRSLRIRIYTPQRTISAYLGYAEKEFSHLVELSSVKLDSKDQKLAIFSISFDLEQRCVVHNSSKVVLL
ncbi:hypothetical protein U1Q18_050940, partial [Sarracenia purpurea var. burkii]